MKLKIPSVIKSYEIVNRGLLGPRGPGHQASNTPSAGGSDTEGKNSRRSGVRAYYWETHLSLVLELVIACGGGQPTYLSSLGTFLRLEPRTDRAWLVDTVMGEPKLSRPGWTDTPVINRRSAATCPPLPGDLNLIDAYTENEMGLGQASKLLKSPFAEVRRVKTQTVPAKKEFNIAAARARDPDGICWPTTRMTVEERVTG
ncbi:hypothetical protein THAOC_32161, partial [Thalassiosira oceanica]